MWAGEPASLASNALPHKAPQYPFVARDYDVEDVYNRGFSLGELMPLNSNGIVTARDSLTIDLVRQTLWDRLNAFAAGDSEDVRAEYRLGKDVRDWQVGWAQADLIPTCEDRLQPISYRPFETHWTYYTGKSRGIHCYPRNEVMRNYVEGPNLGLLVSKAHKDAAFAHVFVTAKISEAIFLSGTTASNAMNVPLYLYPEEHALDQIVHLNLDPKLYAAICKAAGIDPTDTAMVRDGDSPHPNPSPEGEGLSDFRAATGEARPSEVKVFDYIYGVLHAPTYRERFAEFLKIDFPRIPYPPDPDVFAHVSEKGEQLRRLHLMEPAAIGETPYPYHGEGDDVVAAGYPKWDKPSPSGEGEPRTGGRVSADEPGPASTVRPDGADTSPPSAGADGPPPLEGEDLGTVHINKDQHFTGVPKLAWEFHIGGYQPAQKWLKDRRGRALSWDDIGHYQKIVKILTETARIMREIELPLDDATGKGEEGKVDPGSRPG